MNETVYPAGQNGVIIRFMIDHMLIKLGKYLRIAGYDAEWDLTLRTHELILKANAEDRIFVTRNKHLPYQHPVPRRVVLLCTTDPVAQFHQVASELQLDTQANLFSRCIRCNVKLKEVSDKSEISSKVHPNVLQRYEHFHACPSCGTVFWKGSHVRNTCTKLQVTSSDEMTDQ
jgi:uncharacterized protein